VCIENPKTMNQPTESPQASRFRELTKKIENTLVEIAFNESAIQELEVLKLSAVGFYRVDGILGRTIETIQSNIARPKSLRDPLEPILTTLYRSRRYWLTYRHPLNATSPHQNGRSYPL